MLDSQSRTPLSILKETASKVFELVFALIFTFLAVISVSEISSRESFISAVSSTLDSNNSDLAGIINTTFNTREDSLPTSAYRHGFDLLESSRELNILQNETNNLINVGADSQSDTLRELVRKYRGSIGINYKIVEQEETKPDILEYLSQSSPITLIYQLRSDHLLAISIICSSALGAIIFGLRHGYDIGLRAITSGISTGFVVYLALKGGQHLFLITSPDARIAANPFSGAFAGLLAGLFSNKAYKVLSGIIDTAADRSLKSTKNKDDG